MSYFEESFTKSSLVGGGVTSPVLLPVKEEKDLIHRDELDRFKMEILDKINERFLQIDSPESQLKKTSSENDHSKDHAEPNQSVDNLKGSAGHPEPKIRKR